MLRNSSIPKRNEKPTPKLSRELSDNDLRGSEVFRNERELSDADRRSSEVVSKLREKYPMEIGGQRKEFQCKMN